MLLVAVSGHFSAPRSCYLLRSTYIYSLLACWVSCKSPSLYLGARLTVFDETKQKRSQQRSDRSGALQRLPAASAQNFEPVNSFGILIDTSSTFTSRSTFQKKSAGNRRFRSVGASGVAKFAVFACHLAPTSAAAESLLCAHARAQHARARGVLVLLRPPKSHQTEFPLARLRPQHCCDHFCQIPVENRHTDA